MKKSEKVVIITGVIFLILLAISVYWYRNKVNSNATYVLAKVTRVTESGENAPVYFYYYQYNNKRYESKVGGFFTMYDSLLIIKVLKTNPKFCLYTHLAVPVCIRDEKKMDSSWDVLPRCSGTGF